MMSPPRPDSGEPPAARALPPPLVLATPPAVVLTEDSDAERDRDSLFEPILKLMRKFRVNLRLLFIFLKRCLKLIIT